MVMLDSIEPIHSLLSSDFSRFTKFAISVLYDSFMVFKDTNIWSTLAA